MALIEHATTVSSSGREESEVQLELKRIYSQRFSGLESYRNEVWKILTRYLARWIGPQSTVLDLGCGYGEFSNNIQAARKFAIDLNPTAKDLLLPEVTLFQQDCSTRWPLVDGSLDVVFTSNFFEHLPTKASLQDTLLEAYRCLKPGGRIMALGPNVRYLSGEYWDFFDHHLALTERSLGEAMLMTGFQIEVQIARFLPYSMSQGFRPPLWLLRLFLQLPQIWPLFGRQFFVIGKKK